MDERELRQWIRRVKDGRLTRRQFTRMMVTAGLTAPMAAQMLAASGVAHAQRSPRSTPPSGAAAGRSRPSGGRPGAPEPPPSPGTKDVDASRIFYEPLFSFDPDGNLLPVLATEVPRSRTAASRRTGCR